MTKLLALVALAAAGSCDQNRPAPNPVPTIPTVVVTPSHPDAGSECSIACERRKSEGCPSGNVPKTLEHCVAMCTSGRTNLADPSADCLALVFTCNEKCSP